MRTPRLSPHARDRCIEMGIPTKVPKWIVRHADVVRPGEPHSHRLVAISDRWPQYAVVYSPEYRDQAAIVITVVFRTETPYQRNGTTFTERRTETWLQPETGPRIITQGIHGGEQ